LGKKLLLNLQTDFLVLQNMVALIARLVRIILTIQVIIKNVIQILKNSITVEALFSSHGIIIIENFLRLPTGIKTY